MAEFLTFVVSGLAGGASYALLALGLVLVNRSSRILNFAQGEIGALATFVVASLVVDHGWGWPLAIGVGLAVGATTSGAAESASEMRRGDLRILGWRSLMAVPTVGSCVLCIVC